MFPKRWLFFLFSTLAIVFSPPGANANDIGFDIAQISTAEGFQIVVTPNESVRPGDQLIIADEGSGDESTLYALQLKDADSDGVADSVRFTIPQGSAHRLVISVVPVDGSTGSAYCGIGAKQQLNVQGGSRKELVFSGSPDMLTADTLCSDGYFPEGAGIRVEQEAVTAGLETKLSGTVILLSFYCSASPSDPIGSCLKREVASGVGTASVPLDQIASACSVLAKVVYAEDRGRAIASMEEVIRMEGFCPTGYTGIGFDASKSAGIGHRTTMSISGSVAKWIVSQVSKFLGKKTAREIDKAIRHCDIPSGLFWKVVSAIPWIGELLVPCLARG